MPIRAIARLIQTMLYARRFFPYYVYNILGGIEEDGELSHILSHFHMAFLSYAFIIKCAGCITMLTSLFLTLLGTGAVYSFDPVGSYEREACRAAGAAQSLVQPFLDNQVSTSFLISRTNRIF
jgi:20S proteasome subunit beta 6